jgi:hypothetical protein
VHKWKTSDGVTGGGVGLGQGAWREDEGIGSRDALGSNVSVVAEEEGALGWPDQRHHHHLPGPLCEIHLQAEQQLISPRTTH